MVERLASSSNRAVPRTLVVTVVACAIALLAGCSDSSDPSGPQFIVCESTYALCTTAPCTPLADAPGFAACSCSVQTDYSAALDPCQEVQDTGADQVVYSRYHPITSYALCSNDRPWTMCLDSPCTIDKNDPSVATCVCTEMVNQGDYIVVSADGQYSPSSCTTGYWSAATVVDVTQVTDYLATHDTPLKPLPIDVYLGAQ